MTTTGSKSGYTPQQILNYQKNDELLLKTKDVQGKTLQSLDRTKKDLYQADKAADKALQNLQDQREKMISIIDDTNRVYSSLERSEELVHKLGYGFRFPAIFQLSETQKKVYSDIIGIYEHQQYSFMSKSWSSSDFFSSQNTSFSVTDVFDPQLTMEDGRFFWVVDISFSHIDSDGWVYGSSFSEIDKGNGKESSQGFVFNLVRRRVWKRNTEAKISKNEEALMRNIQRKQQQQQSSHDNIPSSSKKSVNNNNDITLLMVGTKYVHNDMTSDQEKSLKEIKATDKKIDEGVEEVEKGVDNLLSKAKLANNEMKVQQVLIEEMDENVDRDLTKVKDVNKQLKHKVDNQCSCIIS